MSLYNLLHGVNLQAPLVLQLLEKNTGDFGRFRDAYITETHLVVHTRCGGGNREDYEHVFDEMSGHPLFDYDQDDDFDCTYCNFYFKHPPDFEKLCKMIAEQNPQMTPTEKWQKLFEALKK